ncbi:sepiapterin reductase a [Sphaeramia orbicularis]|uniref:Sepiapterin reductase n=1 Tax=Sphaeramia orbicularis TaxID=375764 RepID=A0A673B8X8_9TELE|nr:sepiapterin reductase [Sphaeramia orbicularis]
MQRTWNSPLGQALCIITGASRGFGREAATQISRLVSPGSVLILVARSEDDLRTLQAELTESKAGKAGLVVRYVAADLGLMEGVESVVKASKEASSDNIEHLILINNAASLGDVSRFTREFTDMAEVNSYLSLNVSSSLCLTSSVLQAFPQRPRLQRTVVNISSLCALKPFPSWVLYCTGKAARDMMFKVLAEEEPTLRVLNYAPGPMDTHMQDEARVKTADLNVRKSFTRMAANGLLLSCEESCAKLMKLLRENTYESGAHIDVYDV